MILQDMKNLLAFLPGLKRLELCDLELDGFDGMLYSGNFVIFSINRLALDLGHSVKSYFYIPTLKFQQLTFLMKSVMYVASLSTTLKSSTSLEDHCQCQQLLLLST